MPYYRLKERTKRFHPQCSLFLVSVSDVFANAKVMLFASLVMMLLAKARNDVMFAHYAVRRNIIHEVNITAVGNIICPGGQTSFSVNTPVKSITLKSLFLLKIGVTGFEPAASCSQSTRATNCATPRRLTRLIISNQLEIVKWIFKNVAAVSFLSFYKFNSFIELGLFAQLYFTSALGKYVRYCNFFRSNVFIRLFG